MKLHLLYIGKTDKSYIKQGFEEYSSRVKKYLPFEIIEISDIKNTKNMPAEVQKQKEGELILNKLPKNCELILLDENGKELSSMKFAQYIENKMVNSGRDICFCIGGPYGFSEKVYKASSGKISLSKMTFSHQMIRMIFSEQLYRAFSIINNEPYHHQ